ncbi:MAG: response regulator transcription factor [Bacteroidota bacterium]
MLQIFLIEDHQLIIQGIKLFVSSQEDINVVAYQNRGQGAAEEIERYHPDLVLCDINLPDVNGLELAISLKRSLPEIKFAILSMHMDRPYVMKALQSGLDGYLNKDIREDEFLVAVRSMAKGERYFSKTIAQLLMHKWINIPDIGSRKEENLTNREKEILVLICAGYRNREIGAKLEISPKTVHTHRANLIKKLQVKNTAELVKFAVKNHLIEG